MREGSPLHDFRRAADDALDGIHEDVEIEAAGFAECGHANRGAVVRERIFDEVGKQNRRVGQQVVVRRAVTAAVFFEGYGNFPVGRESGEGEG